MPAIPVQTELPRLFRTPRRFVQAYRLPLLILWVGAVADLYTTWHNLRLYGPQVESHIVQRWFSEILGVEWGVPLAKMGQCAFVVLVAAWWKPWTPWILTLCGILYTAASISNYYGLL
ncbi:MAG TPA: hypothetical protein VFE47_20805 [Tepidisphaeraceae bacterium]|jgi:hypothetical protein|nr:hypothetical protein [Tepidisphaeraceae bacterium]